MSEPVFVLAMPRSRTAWLTNWLRPSFEAMHEELPAWPELGHLHVLRTVISSHRFPRRYVFVDTTACKRIDEIMEVFPDARYISIHRPMAEVEQSLANIGLLPLDFDDIAVAYFEATRKVLANKCDTFNMKADDLSSPDVAYMLWNWLGHPDTFDQHRHAWLANVNVQMTAEHLKARLMAEQVRRRQLKGEKVRWNKPVPPKPNATEDPHCATAAEARALGILE